MKMMATMTNSAIQSRIVYQGSFRTQLPYLEYNVDGAVPFENYFAEFLKLTELSS